MLFIFVTCQLVFWEWLGFEKEVGEISGNARMSDADALDD